MKVQKDYDFTSCSVLFLSAQFRSKSSLQFSDDLLIGNCFSRFVFLYDLGLLVYNLHLDNHTQLCLIILT